MTDWKRKKLWLEQKSSQVYTQKIYIIKVLSATRKQFKTTAGRKKDKKECDI